MLPLSNMVPSLIVDRSTVARYPPDEPAAFGDSTADSVSVVSVAVVSTAVDVDDVVVEDVIVGDVAEDVVTPMMDRPIRVDRDSLILGYAGVYSSFLLHAKRAAEKHGVPSNEILVELGRLGTVGGQEDMIEDVAIDLC